MALVLSPQWWRLMGLLIKKMSNINIWLIWTAEMNPVACPCLKADVYRHVPAQIWCNFGASPDKTRCFYKKRVNFLKNSCVILAPKNSAFCRSSTSSEILMEADGHRVIQIRDDKKRGSSLSHLGKRSPAHQEQQDLSFFFGEHALGSKVG